MGMDIGHGPNSKLQLWPSPIDPFATPKFLILSKGYSGSGQLVVHPVVHNSRSFGHQNPTVVRVNQGLTRVKSTVGSTYQVSRCARRFGGSSGLFRALKHPKMGSERQNRAKRAISRLCWKSQPRWLRLCLESRRSVHGRPRVHPRSTVNMAYANWGPVWHNREALSCATQMSSGTWFLGGLLQLLGSLKIKNYYHIINMKNN